MQLQATEKPEMLHPQLSQPTNQSSLCSHFAVSLAACMISTHQYKCIVHSSSENTTSSNQYISKKYTKCAKGLSTENCTKLLQKVCTNVTEKKCTQVSKKAFKVYQKVYIAPSKTGKKGITKSTKGFKKVFARVVKSTQNCEEVGEEQRQARGPGVVEQQRRREVVQGKWQATG